jgi:hypothetical protein
MWTTACKAVPGPSPACLFGPRVPSTYVSAAERLPLFPTVADRAVSRACHAYGPEDGADLSVPDASGPDPGGRWRKWTLVVLAGRTAAVAEGSRRPNHDA